MIFKQSKESLALPIVIIYLFGFKLKDIDQPVIKIARQYVARATNQFVNSIDEFIEQLTHDCYIVQIPKISGKILTSLDTLLSFFGQENCIDANKMYKDYLHPIDDDDEGVNLEAKDKIMNCIIELRMVAPAATYPAYSRSLTTPFTYCSRYK